MTSDLLPSQHNAQLVRRLLGAVAIFAVAMLSGCGSSEYELANVQGTVIIDGRPFAHGTVMFAPVANGTSQNSGRPAFGRLQENGMFELKTGKQEGAVVGEHWATIFAVADPNTSTPARPKFDRVAFPKRIKIEPGKQNVVELKLSAQDISKYGR